MNSEKIDPKYIGVSNICFSLTDKKDDREVKFVKQRINRGFDDSETWSLCNTIASFIIPRLERFIEIDKEVTERSDEFRSDCEKVLIAFRLITRDDGAWIFTEEENIQLESGLKCFPDIFMGLWW
jgi:hypothetical protein